MEEIETNDVVQTNDLILAGESVVTNRPGLGTVGRSERTSQYIKSTARRIERDKDRRDRAEEETSEER